MKYLEKESELKELIKGEFVIVDFYATWCGPCQMIGPLLEELEKEHKNIQVIKIDVEKHEALARKHKAEMIPMLEIYKNEKLIDKVVGYATKEEIEDLLK